MKSLLFTCIAVLCAVSLMLGCATPPAAQSPQQILAQVCPPLTAVLDDLASPLVVMPAGAKADLMTVAPIVTGVCAAGATVDATSLQTLAKTALPALMNAVESASGIGQQAKDNMQLAKIIIDAIVAGQAGGVAGAPVTTAPVAVAPAK